MALAPWGAAVGDSTGVGFDQMDRAVIHESWFGEGRTADERLGKVKKNAAHFATGLRAAANRVNVAVGMHPKTCWRNCLQRGEPAHLSWQQVVMSARVAGSTTPTSSGSHPVVRDSHLLVGP